MEVEPSPNVSGSVLDLLNEFLFDLIVFLLDESLPVVHEDMQFLGTGTGSARIGCMYKLRYEFLPNLNEFLLDLNQWCLLFEPYAFQVDDYSSVTSSGITSWGKERQPNSVSHRGEEATTTVELEEYDSRVESAPGSDVGAAVGVGIGPSVGGDDAVGAAVGAVGASDGAAHVEPGGLSATQEAASVSHGSGAPVADTALHHLEQALHHLEQAASGSGDLHHLEQALHHLEQAASDRKVSSDDARADSGTPMTAAALEMRAARAI